MPSVRLIALGSLALVGAVLAYDASRSEGARSSRDQRVCLYICFGVCAFKFVWGVIYTTWVFVSRRASWARLRAGRNTDTLFWNDSVSSSFER